jgi:hypothetical protein
MCAVGDLKSSKSKMENLLMNATNVITIMALLILGTFIFAAPKELPKETFTLTAKGKVLYHMQVPSGECTRHISTAREVLVMAVGSMNATDMLIEKFVETTCTKSQPTVDPDNLFQDNSVDPYAN